MYSSTLLLLPLFFASYVSAHGFVKSITVEGKNFQGSFPSGQRSDRDSVIRQITTTSPVQGSNNPDINCGPGAFAASEAADVNPGDEIAFEWNSGGGNWPHNTGPMITYLASCGTSTCDKFDTKGARWFKIEELGKKPNKNEWFQADLMAGETTSVTIPSNIAPGNYIIRHEIVALHLATRRGGAEYYPSCSQIRIGGSGTGVPSPDETVTFPGGYSDDHPGIFVPGVFSANLDYQFPGPPVAKLAASNGSSGSGSGSSPSSTKTASGSKPTPTSTGSSGSTKKVCKLKKNSKSAKAAQPTAEVYPRHMSRVMRRLAVDGFSARHSS